MYPRDLHNLVTYRRVISPAANANLGTTPLVGQIIDTQGYDSLEFVIATGTLSDADATYTVLVEEGAASNLSDNTAIPDAALIGTEAQAAFQFGDDDAIRKIGVKVATCKRYIRLTITPVQTADSGNTPVSVIAALGHPSRAAVSSQAD